MRRVALKIIHSNIIYAPDKLREQLRDMTRLQLIRALRSQRPNVSEYRYVTNGYRIALRPLARHYLELHDKIAELDVLIKAILLIHTVTYVINLTQTKHIRQPSISFYSYFLKDSGKYPPIFALFTIITEAFRKLAINLPFFRLRFFEFNAFSVPN